MKKAMGLILAVLLVMGSLAGCQGSSGSSAETGKPRP
jgi:predicted small secreted protein